MESSRTGDLYVIPEGSTEEQKLSREEVISRLETGALSPESLVYDEESGMWIRLSIKGEFAGVHVNGSAEGGAGEDLPDERHEGLELRYRDILAGLEVEPDSFDHLLEAGRLALSLGRREEGFRHYQELLLLDPFNPRVAAEIRRSFSPREYGRFRLLRRKAPFWESPVDLTNALSDGRSIILAAACLSAVLSFIPGVGHSIWLLAELMTVIAAITGAQGTNLELEILRDSTFVRRVCRATAITTLGGAELLIPFLVMAEAGVLIDGSAGRNPLSFIAGSPLMQVALFTAAVLWMPMVVAVSVFKEMRPARAVHPRTIAEAARSIGEEYIYTATAVGIAALVWLMFYALFDAVPVLGRIVSTGSLPLVSALCGFVIGRMGSRNTHLLFPPGPASSEKPRSSSDVYIDSSL